MMNYEIFKEVVKEKFMDYMPDNFKGMELVVMPVEKVNMTYDGISIRGKDTNISPTIYINDMYEKYQNCGDLEETLMAACDLMAMEFAKTPQVVDVDSLYKDANEKVVFQLINTEQNRSFLEQVPHREFQDLSIIYKLVINADAESIQSIKVTNSLAERLGMNEEQLFKYAAENTRRILPPRIRNMNDVMKEMFLSDGMPEEIAEMMIREVPPEQTLWIISNNRGIDGAVSMLYENELHELAENLESDLYILPSSVHEVLAVSTELTEPEELAQMVAEVNMQEVALEERLSNQVYHYDKDLRKLTLADQIRNLAEQSAKSAVDSKALIEAAIHEVGDGNMYAEKASTSLREVVDGIQAIADSAKKIKEISIEQADSMEQVEVTAERIAEVVQNNSAAAQETSATSEELTAQATTLSGMVSVFKLRQ